MKLSQKGRFAPPPRLEGFAQFVSETLQGWDGVIAATHWHLQDRRRVDGADFYVDDETRELGHIHLNGEIHLALTTTLAAEVVARRLAHPFEWDDAWIACRISGPATADRAIALFRLGYDRMRGESERALAARIPGLTR